MGCSTNIVIPISAYGPMGPSGPIGQTGNQGNIGITGPTGPTGPYGLYGYGGIPGGPGTMGATGVSPMNCLYAFFTGSQWLPDAPYYNGLDQDGGNTINFGRVPFPTGQYLCHISLNVRWSGNQGSSEKAANFIIHQSGQTSEVYRIRWAQYKTGSAGHGYGTVCSYSHYFIGNITNNLDIWVQSKNAQNNGSLDLYNGAIASASLAVYNKPAYVITSPGLT